MMILSVMTTAVRVIAMTLTIAAAIVTMVIVVDFLMTMIVKMMPLVVVLTNTALKAKREVRLVLCVSRASISDI
jgi:hypothetical protein